MMNRSRRMSGPVLLLCASAACGGEGAFDVWCNTPGRELWLLLFAAGFGVLGAVPVWLVQMRGLGRWDLRDSPSASSGGAITWAVLASAFVVSGLVLSLLLDGADGCAPQQRGANTLLLWTGLFIGLLLALLGLVGANRWYSRHRR